MLKKKVKKKKSYEGKEEEKRLYEWKKMKSKKKPAAVGYDEGKRKLSKLIFVKKIKLIMKEMSKKCVAIRNERKWNM